MSDPRIIAALNRLLVVQYRSLPQYLTDGAAAPWLRSQDARAWGVIEGISRDEKAMAERVAEMIFSRKGSPYSGEFPVEFTDLNFLSLDYLMAELVYYQKQDIESVESCVADLAADSEAQALAQEALGSARAHLELLEQLVKQPA